MDGATWDLLSKYASDGTMPRLGELQKTSMWGILNSTVPAVTPPAWAALSTGKNPGKTGVYAFYIPTDSIDHFRHMTSLDVHSETLPEMLEKAGLVVHVINLPTFSYPPKIKGTVLGDVLCPPGYAVHPSSLLQKDIFRRYRSFPNLSQREDLAHYARDVRNLEQTRFRCAQELFETNWDFFFVMFSGTDWIQHEAYGDLLRGVESPGVALARSFYEDLDEYLAWFLSKLGPEDYFFLVSDHGFKQFSGSFNINRWLLERGYLRQKPGSSELTALTIARSKLKVPSAIVQAVSKHRRLWRLALNAWRSLAAESALAGRTRPDPSTTVAFSQDTSWGIRVNSKRLFRTGTLDEAGRARVIQRLRGELGELVKRGVIDRCMLGSEVYQGPFAEQAPDLVVFPGRLNFTNSAYGSLGNLSRNGHSPRGVYLINGKGVAAGKSRDASICDILPTILTIFDLEVPNDLDGSSLWGEPRIRKGAPAGLVSSKALTEEEERMIEERLRSLGYV